MLVDSIELIDEVKFDRTRTRQYAKTNGDPDTIYFVQSRGEIWMGGKLYSAGGKGGATALGQFNTGHLIDDGIYGYNEGEVAYYIGSLYQCIADYNQTETLATPDTDIYDEVNNPLGHWVIMIPNDYTEITYNDLKSLRDNSQLTPGAKYRITDYQTMIKSSITNARSAENLFDIIVTALTNNTLDENAKVALHEGDTYFANNDLNAWEIKYCLDNDTTRFDWVNSSCKGAIYYMKDEFNNECPYDFKNIQFKMGASPITGTQDNVFYYTFSSYNGGNIIDYSLNTTSAIHCCENKIHIYADDEYGQYQHLNYIVFLNLGALYEPEHCSNNIIESNCTNICFGNNNEYNHIGTNCSNLRFSQNCSYNTIGSFCVNIEFYDYCRYNTIGNNGQRNTLHGYCSYNTIGHDCVNIALGESCYNNLINDGCSSISFGDYCGKNIIETGCSSIIFGTPSSLQGYYRNITVETGNENICIISSETTSSSAVLRNITVAKGYFKSGGARQTVIHPTVNDNFKTIYGTTLNDTCVEITYDNLKALRNAGRLTIGMNYRIIDYITLVNTPDQKLNTPMAISACHRFDILVTAIAKDKLSEDAKALPHAGYNYFDYANMGAWKIKYCLDNDTNRFNWAYPDNYPVLQTEGITEPGSNMTQNTIFSNDLGVGHCEGDILMKCPIDVSPLLNIMATDLYNDDRLISGAVDMSSLANYTYTWITQNGKYYFSDSEEITGNSAVSFISLTYDYAGGGYFNHTIISNPYVNHLHQGGYGVIYYMKDEFGNECDYDFKNIMFKKFRYNGYSCDSVMYTAERQNYQLSQMDVRNNITGYLPENSFDDSVYTQPYLYLDLSGLYSLATNFTALANQYDILASDYIRFPSADVPGAFDLGSNIYLNPFPINSRNHNGTGVYFAFLLLGCKGTNAISSWEGQKPFMFCYTFNARHSNDNTHFDDFSLKGYKTYEILTGPGQSGYTLSEIVHQGYCSNNIIKNKIVNSKSILGHNIFFVINATDGHNNAIISDNIMNGQCSNITLFSSASGSGIITLNKIGGYTTDVVVLCRREIGVLDLEQNEICNANHVFCCDAFSSNIIHDSSYILIAACADSNITNSNHILLGSAKRDVVRNSSDVYVNGLRPAPDTNLLSTIPYTRNVITNSTNVALPNSMLNTVDGCNFVSCKTYTTNCNFESGVEEVSLITNATVSASQHLKNITVSRGCPTGDINHKTLNDDYHTIYGNTITKSVLNITYDELKDLRDNSMLMPGQKYRITDYMTMVFDEQAISACHRFDIIVTALTNNTLDENAKAALHEGDTYFANCKLDAWEIKYCLDNDFIRFEYALEVTDKIYRLPTYHQEIEDNGYLIRLPSFDGNFTGVYYAGVNGYALISPHNTTYPYAWISSSGYIYFSNNEDLKADGAVLLGNFRKIAYQSNSQGEQDDTVQNRLIVYDVQGTDITKIHDGGYGVIYYMKDEFGNECPYDFKNVMFRRVRHIVDSDGNTIMTDNYNEQNITNPFAIGDSLYGVDDIEYATDILKTCIDNGFSTYYGDCKHIFTTPSLSGLGSATSGSGPYFDNPFGLTTAREFGVNTKLPSPYLYISPYILSINCYNVTAAQFGTPIIYAYTFTTFTDHSSNYWYSDGDNNGYGSLDNPNPYYHGSPSQSNICDATVPGDYPGNVYNNIIKLGYIESYGNKSLSLNNIVFYVKDDIHGNYVDRNCHGLTFGENARKNYIGDSCTYSIFNGINTKIGSNNNCIIIGLCNSIENNIIGSNCCGLRQYINPGGRRSVSDPIISLSDNCIIGDECYAIFVGDFAKGTKIGNYCNAIIITKIPGTNNQIFGNQIGDYCNRVIITTEEGSTVNNIIGNICSSIYLNGASSNYFEGLDNDISLINCDHCAYGTHVEDVWLPQYSSYCKVGSNNENITLSSTGTPSNSNQFRNIIISEGVNTHGNSRKSLQIGSADLNSDSPIVFVNTNQSVRNV